MAAFTRVPAKLVVDGEGGYEGIADGRRLKIRLIDGPYPKLSGKTIRAWWYDPRQGTSAANLGIREDRSPGKGGLAR